MTKRVFVCSPLRGNTFLGGDADPKTTLARNIALAKKLCLAVVKAGHAPYAPHVFFPAIGLDDTNPVHRAAGVTAGLLWLGMADECWVFARSLEECSEGMRAEVMKAEKYNIPVKVVYMPKCWAEFEAELPKAPPKPVTKEPLLRGSNIYGDRDV